MKKGNLEEETTSIDWDDIKRLIKETELHLSEIYTHSNEQNEKILEERAKILATPEIEITLIESIRVLTFILAYERYGIETDNVLEVISLKEVTSLPHTPAFVIGVINYRGRILSIIDLKAFFNLPRKGLPEFARLIVLSDGKMEFGLLADQILGTYDIPVSDIEPVPTGLSLLGSRYLKGMTHNSLILIDSLALLTDQTIIVE